MLPKSFKYVRIHSLGQATERAVKSGARIHAGGTDLLGCLRDGVFGADELVSIGGLSDLRSLTATDDGGLSIGALTTIDTIATDERVGKKYPVLAEAAGAVASPQLRNQGTIGGNLCQKPRCWYYRGEFHCLRKGGETCFAAGGDNTFHCILGGSSCFIVHPSDVAVGLISLDARVRTLGPEGSREIPVEGLHMPPAQDPQRETVLNDGEIITHVIVPPQPQGLKSRYRKVRARRSWDFALAGSALAIAVEPSDGTVRHARVVLAGVAPVPWRCQAAEEQLVGKKLSDTQTVQSAAEAAVADATALEHNGYKIPLVRDMLIEELSALSQEQSGG